MAKAMFIVMSDDQIVGNLAKRLALQYKHTTQRKEAIKKLQKGCFDPDLLYELEIKRVTFIGHAHDSYFGNEKYTPERFVEVLVEECKLPKSIEVIDIFGCEIGFIKNGNGYVKTVSRLLFEKGFKIRVNALTNLESTENFRSMAIESKAPSDQTDNQCEVIVYACRDTPENNRRAEILKSNLLALKVEMDSIDTDILKLQEQIDDFGTDEEELKILYEINVKISEKEAQKEELVEKIGIEITALQDLETEVELYRVKDLRKALDSNPKFQFTFSSQNNDSFMDAIDKINQCIKLQKDYKSNDSMKSLSFFRSNDINANGRVLANKLKELIEKIHENHDQWQLCIKQALNDEDFRTSSEIKTMLQSLLDPRSYSEQNLGSQSLTEPFDEPRCTVM